MPASAGVWYGVGVAGVCVVLFSLFILVLPGVAFRPLLVLVPGIVRG
jgi:hypothetical protein